MTQPRALTPNDRRFLHSLKEALQEPHRGPDAMPPKAVYLSINRSQGWYSRALDPDDTEVIPDVIDLRRIQAITGDRRPLDIQAAWWGEGFRVVAEDRPVEESTAQMLAETASVDAPVLADLIQAAVDGTLSREEAAVILPHAQKRLEQAQRLYDAALRVASPVPLQVAR